MQTSWLVCLKKVIKNKLERELIKIRDCFLDSFGEINENLVKFEKIFSNQTFWVSPRDLYKSPSSAIETATTRINSPTHFKKTTTKTDLADWQEKDQHSFFS